MTTGNPTRDPMMPSPYVITRVSQETYDTFTLELKPEDGVRRPEFCPGQFNMLYMFGTGEVPISISGNPASPDILLHTTRAVGTVTNPMRKLKSGETLGVRGPYGSQWPVSEAEGDDVVIVAGGIGLAPLRPAIYHLLANRQTPLDRRPIDHTIIGVIRARRIQRILDTITHGHRVRLAWLGVDRKTWGIVITAETAHRHPRRTAGRIKRCIGNAVRWIERTHRRNFIARFVFEKRELILDVEFCIAKNRHLGLDGGKRRRGEDDKRECKDENAGKQRGTQKFLHRITCFLTKRALAQTIAPSVLHQMLESDASISSKMAYVKKTIRLQTIVSPCQN